AAVVPQATIATLAGENLAASDRDRVVSCIVFGAVARDPAGVCRCRSNWVDLHCSRIQPVDRRLTGAALLWVAQTADKIDCRLTNQRCCVKVGCRKDLRRLAVDRHL